jgi:adenosylcobinamide-GDP ribazoletransferase
MKTFLAAVEFLTAIPAKSAIPPGRGAIYFPLIGALLGAAGGGLFLAIPAWMAAFLAVALWTLAAKIVREDRLGLPAAIAIAVSFAVRWEALQYVPLDRILVACIISQTVPRAAMVALAWVSRPSVDSLGLRFSSSLTTTGALLAIAQGIAVSMLLGWRAGLLILAAAYLLIRWIRAYFYKRIGGVNADSFGILEQIMEVVILILFASSWG